MKLTEIKKKTISQKLESEIKNMIIEALSLEDMTEDDIETDSPLFNEGLGLDSIDVLELGIALQKKYGIKMEGRSDDKIYSYFRSVKTLTKLVAQKRKGK